MEIDVDVGEQRDFPLFREFIEGEGFFVGKKEGGKTDGWGFRWNAWNEPFSAAALTRHQWLIIQLTETSANYFPCSSILLLSAEGGLLSCEKLYWVSPEKLGTWDSLSKRPTAGVSCREFIMNSVKGPSRRYSYPVAVQHQHELRSLFVIIHSHSFLLLLTHNRRPSFKSKMCVGGSLLIKLSRRIHLFSPSINIYFTLIVNCILVSSPFFGSVHDRYGIRNVEIRGTEHVRCYGDKKKNRIEETLQMRGKASSRSQEQVQLPQLNPSTLKMTWMTENLHRQIE